MCPALENRNILLVYSCGIEEAIAKARKYREDGFNTVLLKLELPREHYNEFALENNISKVVFI
jgi:hypothetical protein